MVSNIFHVHPYLRIWSNLTSIFFKSGWNPPTFGCFFNHIYITPPKSNGWIQKKTWWSKRKSYITVTPFLTYGNVWFLKHLRFQGCNSRVRVDEDSQTWIVGNQAPLAYDAAAVVAAPFERTEIGKFRYAKNEKCWDVKTLNVGTIWVFP